MVAGLRLTTFLRIEGTPMRANGIREGNLIIHDGKLYRVRKFQHITPGKGQAVVQTQLHCITDGSTADVRFRAAEDVETASLDSRDATFLYEQDGAFIFMDKETYEQTPVDEAFLGDAKVYLQEDMEVTLDFYDGSPVGITLPMSVELEITETDPPLKGATASGSNKPATLANGVVVSVPPYIEVGTIIRVDTRTNSYIERVS